MGRFIIVFIVCFEQNRKIESLETKIAAQNDEMDRMSLESRLASEKVLPR